MRSIWRQLIDVKRHNFALRNWYQLLEAITTKNSRLFWSLVAQSSRKEPYKSPLLISPLDWTSYYSKIFSSQDPAPTLRNFPSDLLPWPPVSRDEVIKLIHSPKRGKSPVQTGFPMTS